jgi:hypothetical protein
MSMKPRQYLQRVFAAMLASYFAGCAMSAETAGGQLNQIKPGMTREQVVGNLGEPTETNSLNGAPSEDLYTCDEQGQIVVVRYSVPVGVVEDILFIPMVIDDIKIYRVRSRGRICAVHYLQGSVASTSQPDGNWYDLIK